MVVAVHLDKLNMPNWIKSSADPERISLTLKAGIPFILFALPLLGIGNIETGDLVTLFNAFAALLTGAFTFYGVARKIYYKIYPEQLG